MVPELDGDVVAPEGLGQAVQLGGGGVGSPGLEGSGHRALAAPGEDQPVALVGGRGAAAAERHQIAQRASGGALLPPELGLAHGPGQQGVATRVTGDDHQVGLPRADAGVGVAHRHRRAPEGELGAEDGGQSQLAGRLGEAHHAVEAVVVGEGQGLEPQPGGLLHQLLGRAGAVEEAEVGVAVQLGVGHRPPPPHEGRGLVGLALARPRRAVAAVAREAERITPAGRRGTVGEGPVQRRPRDRWVHPAHGPTLRTPVHHRKHLFDVMVGSSVRLRQGRTDPQGTVGTVGSSTGTQPWSSTMWPTIVVPSASYSAQSFVSWGSTTRGR